MSLKVHFIITGVQTIMYTWFTKRNRNANQSLVSQSQKRTKVGNECVREKKFQTKGVGDKIKRRWGGDGDENCKREQKIQTTLISFIFLYCFVKVHFQKSLQTTVVHMAVISQHIVVVVTSCLPTAILWYPARALFCVKTQTVVNANISF